MFVMVLQYVPIKGYMLRYLGSTASTQSRFTAISRTLGIILERQKGAHPCCKSIDAVRAALKQYIVKGRPL